MALDPDTEALMRSLAASLQGETVGTTFAVLLQTGSTGLQSFTWPVDCVVLGIDATNQTSVAVVSIDGTQSGSSPAVVGSSRSIIATLTNRACPFPLRFLLSANQKIFIDVKVAGTFTFYCAT